MFTDVQRFSVQIYQEIFIRSFWETMYCIFGLPQQVFLLTEDQSVETLHHSKFLSRKACPHHGNFSFWGVCGISHALIYLFHSNFPEVVVQF